LQSRFSVLAHLALAQGLAGCSASGSSTPGTPSAPSSPTLPGASGALAVFTDSATGFSTTDLRDVQEQIVQLDNSAAELIWVADGTRLPGYRLTHPTADGKVQFIEGNICPEGCAFEVRFGVRDGERRAYLTVDYIHQNPGTLVDVELAGGALVVTPTDVYPPGSVTLSGVVSKMTPSGWAPIEGAEVWRLVGYGWRSATTDANGIYRMPGLYDGTERVTTSKEGYLKREADVTINGDTRYDVELVER
jgi:hypothetical protein